MRIFEGTVVCDGEEDGRRWLIGILDFDEAREREEIEWDESLTDEEREAALDKWMKDETDGLLGENDMSYFTEYAGLDANNNLIITLDYVFKDLVEVSI